MHPIMMTLALVFHLVAGIAALIFLDPWLLTGAAFLYSASAIFLAKTTLNSALFPPGLARSAFIVWGAGLALALAHLCRAPVIAFYLAIIHMVLLLWWFGAWIIFTYAKLESAECCGKDKPDLNTSFNV